MKYFNNCTTAEEVKQEYKKLARELHPDNNTDRDTTKDFQEMQREFEKAFEILKNKHKNAEGERYEKATTETAAEFIDLINRLMNIKDIIVELCGSWLWVTGNTMPAKEILKELGFRWSKTKKAWYYNREPFKFNKVAVYSTMDQIRETFGSMRYEREQEELLLA